MKTNTTIRAAGISFMVLMFLMFLGKTGADAQYRSGSGLGSRSFCSPSLIQFTGTLFTPDAVPAAEEQGDVFDLVVNRDKTWAFVIDKARNRSCLETQLSILKDIFPRRLYVHGAQDQIASLENSDIAGKPIIIQGYLYRDSRKFDVTRVETVTAE